MTRLEKTISSGKTFLIFILAIACTFFYTGHHLPTPGPGPPPAPLVVPVIKVSGTLHASLVFDPATITQGLGAIRSSVTIGPALSSADVVWRTFEVSDPALTIAGLKDPAVVAGVPALIVQDKTGKILKAIKAPATEADLLSAVKLIREGR